MEQSTPIQTQHRNGNLHVDLSGHLDTSTACRLASTIAEEYRGTGNIFIHTRGVTSFTPGVKGVLGASISEHRLPHRQLYITGEKGPEISPESVRVIAHRQKKEGCCGRCRECSCRGGKHHHHGA